MLQNAYFLAKIGADTAEIEQHFAEICQKVASSPDAAMHGPPQHRRAAQRDPGGRGAAGRGARGEPPGLRGRRKSNWWWLRSKVNNSE